MALLNMFWLFSLVSGQFSSVVDVRVKTGVVSLREPVWISISWYPGGRFAYYSFEYSQTFKQHSWMNNTIIISYPHEIYNEMTLIDGIRFKTFEDTGILQITQLRINNYIDPNFRLSRNYLNGSDIYECSVMSFYFNTAKNPPRAKLWEYYYGNGYYCNITLDQYNVPFNLSSLNPTTNPSTYPTYNPTMSPTTQPTQKPSNLPSNIPSNPTHEPSDNPTNTPSHSPSKPTILPTRNPSLLPTINPTHNPSNFPTYYPSHNPSYNPTNTPSILPTMNPTKLPTKKQITQTVIYQTIIEIRIENPTQTIYSELENATDAILDQQILDNNLNLRRLIITTDAYTITANDNSIQINTTNANIDTNIEQMTQNETKFQNNINTHIKSTSVTIIDIIHITHNETDTTNNKESNSNILSKSSIIAIISCILGILCYVCIIVLIFYKLTKVKSLPKRASKFELDIHMMRVKPNYKQTNSNSTTQNKSIHTGLSPVLKSVNSEINDSNLSTIVPQFTPNMESIKEETIQNNIKQNDSQLFNQQEIQQMVNELNENDFKLDLNRKNSKELLNKIIRHKSMPIFSQKSDALQSRDSLVFKRSKTFVQEIESDRIS